MIKVNNEKEYINEITNSDVNGFLVTLEVLESVNSNELTWYWYDPEKGNITELESEVSHKGLVEFCTFDVYGFSCSFIKRHNLSEDLLNCFEKDFYDKCVKVSQAVEFFQKYTVRAEKVIRKIGAYSTEEKLKEITIEDDFCLEKLWYKEFINESKTAVLSWCIKNDVPFVIYFDQSYSLNVGFDGDVTEFVNINIDNDKNKQLFGSFEYSSVVKLDSVEFDAVELQKNNSSEWETYLECDKPHLVKNYHLGTTYMFQCVFNNLPSGEYRLKAHFFVSAQNTDMKIYEQEGLFYSDEVKVD